MAAAQTGVGRRPWRRGGAALLAAGAAVVVGVAVLLARNFAPAPQRQLEIRMEQPFSPDALGEQAVRLPDVAGEEQYLARERFRVRLTLPDGRVLDADARDLFLGIRDGRARSVSFSIGGNHTREEMDALVASVQQQLAPGAAAAPAPHGCHVAGADSVCFVIRAFEDRYSLRVEVNPRRADS